MLSASHEVLSRLVPLIDYYCFLPNLPGSTVVNLNEAEGITLDKFAKVNLRSSWDALIKLARRRGSS